MAERSSIRMGSIHLASGMQGETVGLDPDMLQGPEGAAIFAGNALPDGARPIAQAYAGHQFGHPTVLGDGRAILLGEQVTQEPALPVLRRPVELAEQDAGPPGRRAKAH